MIVRGWSPQSKGDIDKTVRDAEFDIEEIRDENGHRLCDMLYDVQSDHVSVIFKHGPEKYTISFEEMVARYKKIKKKSSYQS